MTEVDLSPLIARLRRGVIRKVAHGRGGVRVDIEATDSLMATTADILSLLCGKPIAQEPQTAQPNHHGGG